MINDTLLQECAQRFRTTQSAMTLLTYKRRDNRLSFDERLSIIKEIEQCYAPLFLELRQEAPGLSDSDLIYCALQNQGFDTVTIAECLTISKDGVRMRKHRLKEKLSQECLSAILGEQKRNKQKCNESVMPDSSDFAGGTVTLSAENYQQLIRQSMKTRMTFKEAAVRFTKGIITFSGRARRSEFWYGIIFANLLSIAVGILNLLIAIPLILRDKPIEFLTVLPLLILNFTFAMAVCLAKISCCVRRLHDVEKSGWWVAMPFVPNLMLIIVVLATAILGHNTRGTLFTMDSPEAIISIISFMAILWIFIASLIALMLFLVKPGTEGPNLYGADPTLPGQPVKE